MGYEAIEAAHGLPVGVLAAVIRQESGGDPWASRYEPGFYARYGLATLDVSARPPDVSEATERAQRATSWGLMQVMGQVAREHGYAGKLTRLLDPTIGVEYGARHLAAKLAIYKDLGDALSAYNAGIPTTANRNNYVTPILDQMTL